ncbi:MAG: homospermidine synthase [Candidatus Lloydbacteria bacterium RIFCSPHIGHO2_02_FULL_54_17]|uniref:Homospermidine synthase n=1 Tax=Candidatus Lloydbacteria bacterium RIFCSPHIGHO2_02_FULL_54_17 TaxID=1798664 RepID=A0A1G2DAW7_9BACT|nr:MAG: homospermidine synthase [Candidatus Lloydbacteria bacterium RIFCSPHIGHO2_01_FULL_54_11]OGZ10775.1 MAG: homospermidine synthase [Candidatus Lloydbacteria bacterium RIFCSPHIGHO2_02_FULL_54_17]OGZ13076.1 MAG: homospermidine synthase [Candidatus Lloydbacteria bacterium RIFCSPLOWO2_01_FULL_54_18]OGZ16523.1 MAG: homospermidine synthase [Candidatus Lloydbacteria bacterium RIFCSPLOWO2_02_FULL_54_12]
MQKQPFTHNVTIVGFGSIGQGVLPLLFRHFDLDPSRVVIITADDRGKDVAEKYGVRFILRPLTPSNYVQALKPHVSRGDFLLNLSVDVSSVALIKYCQNEGALYLDTCIEPWSGEYTDPKRSVAERSNYALRESARALRSSEPRPTAIIAHGANPGIVSHFVKDALLQLAKDIGLGTTTPATQEEWAKLAMALDIKTIHIAERDTQVAEARKKMGEFVNTWSVDGFCSEGNQPSEMGWGTHEKKLPEGARKHRYGSQSAIYLLQPGFLTAVRSWTPISGPQHSWIITHNEAISIADYLTVRDGEKRVRYRPTVHYAYRPCDDAVLSLHELAGRNGTMQDEQRLINEEILPGGADQLGVLLMGHKKNAYWYGSHLTIDAARALVPHNSATSLQVTGSVIGGMVWAIANPDAGVVDADEIDHRVVMDIARPYMGKMMGVYTDWTPLDGRGVLFPEPLHHDDPWQFSNFRVS